MENRRHPCVTALFKERAPPSVATPSPERQRYAQTSARDESMDAREEEDDDSDDDLWGSSPGRSTPPGHVIVDGWLRKIIQSPGSDDTEMPMASQDSEMEDGEIREEDTCIPTPVVETAGYPTTPERPRLPLTAETFMFERTIKTFNCWDADGELSEYPYFENGQVRPMKEDEREDLDKSWDLGGASARKREDWIWALPKNPNHLGPGNEKLQFPVPQSAKAALWYYQVPSQGRGLRLFNEALRHQRLVCWFTWVQGGFVAPAPQSSSSSSSQASQSQAVIPQTPQRHTRAAASATDRCHADRTIPHDLFQLEGLGVADASNRPFPAARAKTSTRPKRKPLAAQSSQSAFFNPQ